MLQKLGKGDEVITRGGVIGKITGVVRRRRPRARAAGEGPRSRPARLHRRQVGGQGSRVRRQEPPDLSLYALVQRCIMDRSLKWRTLALLVVILLCVGIARAELRATDRARCRRGSRSRRRSASGSISRADCTSSTASTSTRRSTIARRELKRDLESRFADEKHQGRRSRRRATPLGAVTVLVARRARRRPRSRARSRATTATRSRIATARRPTAPNAICFRVVVELRRRHQEGGARRTRSRRSASASTRRASPSRAWSRRATRSSSSCPASTRR